MRIQVGEKRSKAAYWMDVSEKNFDFEKIACGSQEDRQRKSAQLPSHVLAGFT